MAIRDNKDCIWVQVLGFWVVIRDNQDFVGSYLYHCYKMGGGTPYKGHF